MEINIKIEDEKSKSLTQEAQQALEKKLNEYSKDLLEEAFRLEEGERQEGVGCEITGSIILKAANKKRYAGENKSKKSKLVIGSEIISQISLMLVGLLFSPEDLTVKGIRFWVFLICVVIACVSTVIMYTKE